MGSRIPSTRLLAIFSVICSLIAIATFFGHRIIENEISVYKEAPRLTNSEAISETQNRVCWMRGMFRARNPERLVVSHAARARCIYYRYTSETWVESTDSNGDTWTSWGTVEDVKGFSHLPLLVGNSEYTLSERYLRVKGGLKLVYDKNERHGDNDYRNKEEIIPDLAEVWVLGIPEGKTIREEKFLGLVITMGTIEAIYGERSIPSNIILVISFMFLCLAIFLVSLLVKMLKHPRHKTDRNVLLPKRQFDASRAY